MGKYNSIGNANGGFLGNSSFKPIAGHVTRDMFLFALNQAKISDGFQVVAGTPVKLTNPNGGNAGAGLAPNVFLASSATQASDVSGFVVSSPNDVLEMGSGIASPVEGQIASVAVLGSGIEIYLPCDDTLQNVNINSKAEWDFATNKLKLATTGGSFTILSGVVDGTIYTLTNGVASTIDSKVILVRL